MESTFKLTPVAIKAPVESLNVESIGIKILLGSISDSKSIHRFSKEAHSWFICATPSKTKNCLLPKSFTPPSKAKNGLNAKFAVSAILPLPIVCPASSTVMLYI